MARSLLVIGPTGTRSRKGLLKVDTRLMLLSTLRCCFHSRFSDTR